MPCSVCRQSGHNIRTCPVKIVSMMEGVELEVVKARWDKLKDYRDKLEDDRRKQNKLLKKKAEQEKKHEKFVKEVKGFDEEEESPPDTWFYGELTEPVKDVDALTKIMVKGIKKFKKYLEVSELEEVCENEELSSTIDLWFDHDSLRNKYFDELIKEHEFDAFCSRVISQAFEDN